MIKNILVSFLSLAMVFTLAVPTSLAVEINGVTKPDAAIYIGDITNPCGIDIDDIIIYKLPEQAEYTVYGGGETPKQIDSNRSAIVINDDQNLTNNPLVTLNFHMYNAEQMLVSNDDGFREAVWQPYTSKIENWPIWTDSGRQSVHVIFRNAYGTTQVFRDDIFYKTTNDDGRKKLIDWMALWCASIQTGQATEEQVNEINNVLTQLPALPQGVTPGQYLKASNGSVFYIGSDQKKHLYPNDKIWSSWNQTFNAVVRADDEILSQIQFGKNIAVRPGTNLIKIESDPKVYAVEAGYVLRPIQSEEAAKELYGENWASLVIDIPVTFFADYTINSIAPLDKNGPYFSSHPTGTIVRDNNGVNYKVEKGELIKIDNNGFIYNDYQARFVIQLPPSNDYSLSHGYRISDEILSDWEYNSLPTGTYYEEQYLFAGN